MKRLRYKTKKEPEVSLEDLPTGFTHTHAYEYKLKNGKVKPQKKKLTQQNIKKLKNERKES